MANKKNDTSDRELRVSRLLDAPVELVWEVWTRPEHLSQWWGPDGFTNTIDKMDVRQDGVWDLVMHGPDGTDYKNRSVFREVIPLRRLVYEHLSSPQFTATIQLEARGQQTFLTWQMLFQSAEQLAQVVKIFKANEGLKQNIEKLNRFLTGFTKADFESGYAPVNGIRMYYEVHGKGDIPLVLVHGGGSTIDTTFSRLLPLLSARHRIVAVELQAHGRTTDRDSPESFQQDADDVAALLGHLGVDRADLLGFSNGGCTVMQVAIRHPALVNRIVVISGAYRRDGFIPGFFDGFPGATLEDMPIVLREAFLKVTPDNTRLQNMFEKDVERMKGFTDWSDEEIRSIKAPALVISSDRDVVTPEHSARIARLIPGSQLVILPGGHGSVVGAMEAGVGSGYVDIVARLVGKFLWLFIFLSLPALGRAQKDSLVFDWGKTMSISKSVATLQVVVNPPLRRESPIHDQAFAALAALGCDYVRYVPWLPYPRLGVAELQQPDAHQTYWDFSLIDPLTIDFLAATKGHPVVLNFSTIPAWMYRTDKPVPVPANPDSVVWDYTQGEVPRDTTLREIGNYYGRLFSWYTKGGFRDELGKEHVSGYHYDIPYWEVLNEVDYEHVNTARSYTQLYDAVVTSIRKVAPKTKFVGLALLDPVRPDWYEYFLDRRHHKPGIPLDMISYHFYASGSISQGVGVMQYTFFDQADGFLKAVHFIEGIRKRLSPSTKTAVNEIGSILNSDFSDPKAAIPDDYWNLSGALYSYVYLGLLRMGVDIIGESQLVGYPTQFPSVSMINWKTGKPNARYWVLKIIKDNFGPGDTLVNTSVFGDGLVAQGLATSRGKRALLINRTDHMITLALPSGSQGGKFVVVDPSTGDNEPASGVIGAQGIELKPFAVGVLGW